MCDELFYKTFSSKRIEERMKLMVVLNYWGWNIEEVDWIDREISVFSLERKKSIEEIFIYLSQFFVLSLLIKQDTKFLE